MKIVEVVPWLVGAEGTGWGEYLFVEVRTDEGISGWGEVTTTTPAANRGVAAMVRQGLIDERRERGHERHGAARRPAPAGRSHGTGPPDPVR